MDVPLSGPHGTSNFDRQSLIYSDLNYTNHQLCSERRKPFAYLHVSTQEIKKTNKMITETKGNLEKS